MKSQRKAQAAAQAVFDALYNMVPGTPLGPDVTAKGSYDLTAQWAPDPVMDRPRYTVTATVALVTSTP